MWKWIEKLSPNRPDKYNRWMRDELEVAAETVLRLIVNDDELWNEVPCGQRSELVQSIVGELPNMLPERDQAEFRGLIALLARQAKKNASESGK